MTVLHAVKDKLGISHGIIVDYDLKKGGTHLFPIDDFCVCAMGSLQNTDIKEIDFAMKKIAFPMPPCKLLINKESEGDYERIDRIALTSDFSVLPTFQEEYGFSGLIQPEIIPTSRVHKSGETQISTGLYSSLAYYDNVRYVQTHEDVHVFALENKGYTHKSFKGTSGAPIIDSKGNLVSLVMKGGPSPTNSNEWFVYGVNIFRAITLHERLLQTYLPSIN